MSKDIDFSVRALEAKCPLPPAAAPGHREGLMDRMLTAVVAAKDLMRQSRRLAEYAEEQLALLNKLEQDASGAPVRSTEKPPGE